MQTVNRLLLVLLCTGFVAANAAPAVDPANPPEGLFADDWSEVYMGGEKTGFGHSTMTREGDRIHTRTEMTLQIKRGFEPLTMKLTQGTTETLAGRPISFETITDFASVKLELRGTVDDGRVSITMTQYGFDRVESYDYPTGALMTWGAYRESVIRGFQPGTEYTLDIYEPSLRLDGAVQAVTSIKEWGTFEHNGKKQRALKTEQQLATPAFSFTSISWIDNAGEVLMAEIPMPGLGDLRLYATDQETALNAFAPPELFMTTILKVRPIDKTSAQEIRYLIKAKNPKAGPLDLPTTPMQAVKPLEDGAVEVAVRRLEYKPSPRSETAKDPSADAEMAPYLGGNLMMNTDDPELRTLAKKAAGQATEPFALADQLRRFVTDYIRQKDLSIGFATASEVCRNRVGDCSEHGVLLAALGRIRGLPSRVVVGIAYAPTFGEDTHLFGYHMWTQFFIDGRWFDYDAALRETECSPARIAFAVSSLQDASLADLSLPLLSKIGAIDLEVLEVR